MKKRAIIASIIVLASFALIPNVYSGPSVDIVLEKTTYAYCEKLFYTIEVSEVTGDLAIIHIRDESGKGSSAIPIGITELHTPVPSLAAFQEEIFPVGKYFIEIEYSGTPATAEFTLVEGNVTCIPEVMKPIMSNWLSGNISDGFLLDAFDKFVKDDIINIPFEIDESNVYNIHIPEWVKDAGFWWLQGQIPDDEFVYAINYLLERQIISLTVNGENEI